MEFLKANYIKLITAAALLFVLVLLAIDFFNVAAMPGTAESAGALVPLTDVQQAGLAAQIWLKLAIIVAVISFIAALILSMFKQGSSVKIVILTGAAISLVLFVVSFIVGAPVLADLADKVATAKATLDGVPAAAPESGKAAATFGYEKALSEYQGQLFGSILNLVIFAVAPLLYALHGLFVKKQK